MDYDWSDAWLQQAAGWKAVKDGLALHQKGLVQNARLNEGDCQGLLIGAKNRRVKVQRLSATLAETFCGCSENLRTGAMCEHAVAVILAARESKNREISTDSTPACVSDALKTSAYRVRFFPSWEREWSRGRLTVSIEKSDRPVDEQDELLRQWLMEQGMEKRACPMTISLQADCLESFLRATSGHSEIICDKQTIVCNVGSPELPVTSRLEEEGWVFEIAEEFQAEFLGGGSGSWIRFGKRLFEINEEIDRQFLHQLITEKSSQVTHYQYFTSNYLRRVLVPSSQLDDTFKLELCPVSPRWQFHVDGSLRQLRLVIQKVYEAGGRSFSFAMNDTPTFLCQISNKCFYALPSCDRGLRSDLTQQGWNWRDDRQEWQLCDEHQILTFLAECKHANLSWAGEWFISSQLSTIRDRVVIVTPTLDVSSPTQDSTRLRLGFVTEQGGLLDPEKIRRLLQSGKRLIQTNDGKSLILPQESWDVFQRSVADLQLVQKQGDYWASRHQSIAIEYLRKYIDKKLEKNHLLIEQELSLPLLKVNLREYQRQGVSWLNDRLNQYGFCLLADEMGLGKTLQTIALLSVMAAPNHPALVVVPTSLLNNWRLEIERFAPDLLVLIVHGSNRDELHAAKGHHVIVTSYGVLMNDRALFMKREYSLMVLDEASAIRNPDTDVARCVFRMNSRYKLALTGTPLENHLRDLWSIFQFLQPGYLGDRKVFRETYESNHSVSVPALQSLRIRVMPFMLRRTKEEVAKDLPEKIESDEWCDLSPHQTKLYQSVWEEGMAKVESLSRESESAGRMSLLTLLLRLRQICCDAALIAPELEQEWSIEQRSRKMERLFEISQGAIDSGRKMLVFSQFAQQLQLIRRESKLRGIETLILDGSTRNRHEIVERFQRADGPSMFLISLKAGGYGLNLVEASTVVHFDPWWNPAAERQASDRAHRIGQTQAVNVYRLLTRGTVEERVKKLQREKALLADQLFGDSRDALSSMPSVSQLHDLLRVDS